jgi:hypothetical protein
MTNPKSSEESAEESLFREAFPPGYRQWPSIFERGLSGAAYAVLAIALIERGLRPESREYLRQLYEALTPELGRGDYRLVCSRARPGRPQELDRYRHRASDANIAFFVEFLSRGGTVKKEAVVARVGEVFGLSRTAVFGALARHKANSSNETP